MKRNVRFGDTDGAGVIHFHQLFRWSHEAWEESLEKYGLSASEIFPDCRSHVKQPNIALPIVHCEASFLMPIRNGDNLLIKLTPTRIDLGSFQVQFTFTHNDETVAKAVIRHLSIETESRQRCNLPKVIDLWLEASSINSGVKPI